MTASRPPRRQRPCSTFDVAVRTWRYSAGTVIRPEESALQAIPTIVERDVAFDELAEMKPLLYELYVEASRLRRHREDDVEQYFLRFIVRT